MELILFTTNFPFCLTEPFLENEVLCLSKYFDRITLVPLTDSGNPKTRGIPDNVEYLSPLLPVSLDDKIRLIFRAIFNKAPLRPFLADFFKNKVCLRKSWFLHWLSAISVARAAMASKTFQDIMERIHPSTLIYFYWSDKSSALCPFLKKSFPANKFIVRFHGTDLYETKTPGYMPFREDLIRNLDLAVFVSENGERYFKGRHLSGSSLKTLVARLGVTNNGLGLSSQDGILRIVTCSKIGRIKRLHLLVEALFKIDFPVEWTHIGDGELFDELKEISAKLSPHIQVHFPGFLNSRDVIEYYQHQPVDLFINTSSHEGLPVAIMEAISYGIPVIAPDVGGIPEIVEDEHGFLLSAEANPGEIATAIRTFFHQPEEDKQNMRIAARNFWKRHFDADTNYPEFCRQLTQMYDT